VSVRVVSRGELRETLRAHADDPTLVGLRYYELRQVIGKEDWEKLDEVHQGWYIPNTEETGGGHRILIDFVLSPGSYDAWVIET
jgi:hypothetical protein